MMSDVCFELLLCLPTVLCCEVLSTWLYVPNIAKLDSAYCNHEKRAMFHALYEQPELICSLNHCPLRNEAWLLKRKIRLNQFKACEQVPTDVALPYLQDFGQCIELVTLFNGVDVSVVKAIAKHCLKVSKLQLHDTTDVSLAFLNNFRNLNCLELFNESLCEREQSTSQSAELLSVRKVKLWGNLAIGDILFLLEKCPYVIKLSLQFTCIVPTESVVTAITQLSRLTALNISGLRIDDTALALIAHNCPLIVKLDLSYCRGVTDVGVKTVATTLKLKIITLACDKGLTDSSLENLSYCSTSLEALNILQTVGFGVNTNQLTLPAVEALLKKTHNKCQYTWRTNILRHDCNMEICANASSIIIADVLTDALLFELSQNCMALECITIHKQAKTNYTSSGIYAVINNCPKLKVLSFMGKIDKTHLADVLASHGKYFATW